MRNIVELKSVSIIKSRRNSTRIENPSDRMTNSIRIEFLFFLLITHLNLLYCVLRYGLSVSEKKYLPLLIKSICKLPKYSHPSILGLDRIGFGFKTAVFNKNRTDRKIEPQKSNHKTDQSY